MSSQQVIGRMLRLVLLAAVVWLGTERSANPESSSQTAAPRVVQFDAVIELSAPILKSHVVLFARYWVAPTFYKIAVLWAEPHALSLNFPMYPVTTIVDSNDQRFSITNQVQGRLSRTFSKPVGQRGIFRHKLNAYAIGDLRFTETEALAARLYRDDLGLLPPWPADGVANVELPAGQTQEGVERQAVALNLHVASNEVNGIEITDANGLLGKRIAYQYLHLQGRSILCGQEVLLPERPLLLGYGERGVKIRVNDQERAFKELYGLDHVGGRKCRVQYDPVPAADANLPLPTHIVVQRADNGLTLRTARMSGFAFRRATADEVEHAAQRAGPFSREELRVRALFAKYWSADPNKITSEDAQALSDLRAHFETSGGYETAGERLRRTHMLMQLDWLQGMKLIDHYRQYLRVLTAQGLHTAAFLGGLNVIDTAAQRRQYSTADALLREWADHVTGTMETPALLILARSQVRRGHFWTIARLLEDNAKYARSWGLRQFDAKALRCLALHTMLETVRDPSKKTRTAGVQIAWASGSLDLRDLPFLVNETLADAKRLFEELAKPDSQKKTLKKELDIIEPHLREAGRPPSPEECVSQQKGGAEDEARKPARIE